MNYKALNFLISGVICAVISLGCCYGVERSNEKITIVDNGECKMPIIVFEGAPPYIKRAANELSEYIEQISGAKPEVIIGEPKETPEKAIWVGVQPKVKELFSDIDFDFKNPEEILISINNNNIVIAGRDVWDDKNLVVQGKFNKAIGRQQEYGTINAVYTFLQDFLDVRWLWPGELGEDIIKKDTIALSQTTYRYHPQMRVRAGLLAYSGLTGGGYGISMEWMKFQRLQLDSLDINAGHPFWKWWKRFHETHPEYFALQPDGTRNGYPSPENAKLCVSNPDVWKEWLNDVEELLKKDPKLTIFSAAPNDGWTAGHCVCEKCRAWDNPKGEPRRLTWEGLGQMYVPMSDRDVTFANHCAKLLKEKYPGKDYYVLMGSYGHSRPIPIEAVPADNVIVLSVANFLNMTDAVDRASTWGTSHKEQFIGWSKVAKNIMWRPNVSSHVGWQQGQPDITIQQTIKDFKLIAKYPNCIGIHVDTVWEHWATQGPQYYIMGQLVWNPSIDANAVLDDYYARGFKEGADDIKAYWNYLEETRTKYIGDDTTKKVRGNKGEGKTYWDIYNAEFFKKANAFLNAAVKKVENEPEIYRKRVNYLRVGLDFTELMVEIRELMDEYNKSGKKATEAAEKVKENWKVIEKLLADNPYTINWGPIRPITPRMKGLHPDPKREDYI